MSTRAWRSRGSNRAMAERSSTWHRRPVVEARQALRRTRNDARHQSGYSGWRICCIRRSKLMREMDAHANDCRTGGHQRWITQDRWRPGERRTARETGHRHGFPVVRLVYPHMSLYDNMAFGLKLAGMKKPEIESAVRNAAKILHIDHVLECKPKQPFGGQRQRVAIGRAITRKPKVFLFDEPVSNPDAALRVKMRLEFARLHSELTMIYVTHDQVEAMTLARSSCCRQAMSSKFGYRTSCTTHRPTSLSPASLARPR